MNDPTNYTQGITEPIDVEFTSVVPQRPGLLDLLLRSSDPLHERMRQEAELASFRTQLTEFSLARIGAASMMEQHISSIAPHAAARCRAIVDASTVQAIEQIRRW